MKRGFFVCIVTLVTAMALVGCGRKAPPFEEVEQSLNTPSGTVSANTSGVAVANYEAGQTASANSSATKYSGISFLQGYRRVAPNRMDAYLVKNGVPAGLVNRVMQLLPFDNDLNLRRDYFDEQGGLSTKAFSFNIPGCMSVSGDTHEGRISINLGCTKEGSGTLTVVYRGYNDGGVIRKGELEIIFANVCDGQNHCIDGSVGLKTDVSGYLTATAEGSIVYAYNLKVTNGTESIEAKGGFRISYNKSDKAGKVEYLVYVTADGKEASLVIEFEVKGSWAKLSIRGNNGTFECTSDNKGRSGSCKGTGSAAGTDFSWNRT